MFASLIFKQIIVDFVITSIVDANFQQSKTTNNKRFQKVYLKDAVYYQHKIIFDNYDENEYYKNKLIVKITNNDVYQYKAIKLVNIIFQHEVFQINKNFENFSNNKKAKINFVISTIFVFNCCRCLKQF